MNDGDTVVAIVAAHGDLAAGLVSAVQEITGRGQALHPLSNRDLSREALEALLAERIEAFGVRVVFTDLPAGSCAMAAQKVARSVSGVTVVTGVNLPVLLHFIAQTADTDPSAAAAASVERGTAALRVHPGTAHAR